MRKIITSRQSAAATLVGAVLFSNALQCQAAPVWIRQLGVAAHAGGHDVSADGLGNVYVAGGSSLQGFVSKLDYYGNLQWWFRQPDVHLEGISTDEQGDVFVTGSSGYGTPQQDVVVGKYNAHGVLQWLKMIGGTGTDVGHSISADRRGNLYVSGRTTSALEGVNAGAYDAFVSKFNVAGDLLWTRQIGTFLEDVSVAVSSDGLRNVFITGFSSDPLGEPFQNDQWLAKYDADGQHQWTQRLDPTSGGAFVNDIVADGLGNAYVTGAAFPSGRPEDSDGFLSKYDAAGAHQWTSRLSGDSRVDALSVAVDGIGSVFVSGYSEGSLGGPHVGREDLFLAKFDVTGDHDWTFQFGTTQREWAEGVTSDGKGNVYVAGWTQGRLGLAQTGGQDTFVASFMVPEPGSSVLAFMMTFGMCLLRRWRT
jgi:hypothetical protein